MWTNGDTRKVSATNVASQVQLLHKRKNLKLSLKAEFEILVRVTGLAHGAFHRVPRQRFQLLFWRQAQRPKLLALLTSIQYNIQAK